MVTDVLTALKSNQVRAVTYLHGPLKIVVGAGTGKTIMRLVSQ